MLGTFSVVLYPILELLGHIGHSVHAAVWIARRLAVENALGVSVHLILGFQYGDGVAAAMLVPACELEILGVLALEVVADVGDGVVGGRGSNLNAYHEVHLLPAQVVGCAVGDVGFGGCEAAGLYNVGVSDGNAYRGRLCTITREPVMRKNAYPAP